MYHLYRRTCGWILRYAYRTLWREYVDWGCSGPGCIYGNVWCGSNFQGIFVIIREKKIEFAKGGGKYVVVYWWWNHNLCVRYVYLLKAGLNMEINRRMEILSCRWTIWVLFESHKNRWCFICPIWNYYDYASIYFGVTIPVCRIENTLPAIMVERVSCVCGIIFQYQFSVRILAPRWSGPPRRWFAKASALPRPRRRLPGVRVAAW